MLTQYSFDSTTFNMINNNNEFIIIKTINLFVLP